MSIHFVCPNCQKNYTAKDFLAGKRAKCAACGSAIEIPSGESEAVEEDDELQLAPEQAPDSQAVPEVSTQTVAAALAAETPKRRQILSTGMWYLLAGLALAPIFTLTPYLQIVGWVFSAVVHETGHTLFAFAVGCPALPAVSLTGHGAATIHGQQTWFVALAVWAALGWLAWRIFRETDDWLIRGAVVAVTIAFPFVAFHETTRQMGHLLSGHGFEILVACIFLWRASTGMFTEPGIERLLYSFLGWYLLFSNAYLTFGIAYLPKVRSWYTQSGSFGLTNDYIRAAEDILFIDIKAVVLSMLLVIVASACVSLWLGLRKR
jgi:hypothetical protein